VSVPPLLVLTDRTQCAGPLVATIATAVRCGARAVVLREKDLPDPARAELAAELRAVLEPVGGVLIVAGRPDDTARPAAVDAVHLAAADAFPRPRPRLVGRSCHSAEEMARAAAQGCDYVTVSPVFGTPSKPGYGPPLGVDGLAGLVRLRPPASALSRPPAYALAGIRPGDVAGCVAAGAAGVAVMGPVMRDPRIVAEYLSALRSRLEVPP